MNCCQARQNARRSVEQRANAERRRTREPTLRGRRVLRRELVDRDRERWRRRAGRVRDFWNRRSSSRNSSENMGGNLLSQVGQHAAVLVVA